MATYTFNKQRKGMERRIYARRNGNYCGFLIAVFYSNAEQDAALSDTEALSALAERVYNGLYRN